MPSEYTYRIINTYPHDIKAFTQGLVFDENFLYEGTGIRGYSTLKKIDLEKNATLKKIKLSPLFFGEGITIFKSNIIQLTHTSKTGFVYDKTTFKKLKSFSYNTEGWGITHNEKYLIMSNGTSFLYFLDPEKFTVKKKLRVTCGDIPVKNLNELEFAENEIFANIWKTDKIAIISPETGEVTGWIDLTGILPEKDRTPHTNVLNGIAYDKKNNHFFVTGKLWPKLFEIELIEK